ncbi:MAG TPA: carboxypeptidase regulatory-like domain-containing protein [Bryobacteraceae bacterium]|nr:carboxypeptidase regulatory-like domain-containing protein [Bryobacteraceae bacterium]
MNKLLAIYLLALSAHAQAVPGLRGTVTDPSGAAIPGAMVQARGPGGDRRTKTNSSGQYVFPSLTAGRYQVRITAKGFALVSKAVAIDAPAVLDAQLAIQTGREVVTVEDRSSGVSAAPDSNAGALVLRSRELAVLSDDPDELALQLQILAGPAPGPDGGQIFIDGFSGGGLPPKASIREVRINSNPFSPEYDHPGFARIDVFTKPGSENFRGQAFANINDAILNSRNPLLTQTSRPPYRTQLYALNIGGPIKKNKASFTFDLEHRQIGENAFILATTLDSNFQRVSINQALLTPQTRTSFTPRIDYAINDRNALAIRYQDLQIESDNLGAGDFSLASRAYNERQTERVLQLTETSTLSAHAINETRFQYLHSTVRDTPQDNTPGIYVQGAFFGGGATIGNSSSATNAWEITNLTIWTKRNHTFKWGGRVRQSFLDDTSRRYFAGTYTFLTLAQYEKTLELQAAGYTGAQIEQLGYGPYQFSLNSGIPTTAVSQTDAGLFLNDDWRLRPNLTLSAGLRYEAQNNFGDRSNFAPRLGIAWGIGGKGNRPAKTVLRAGAGIFYDRLPLTLTLNSVRYNGTTQQSYVIPNPVFFPAAPAPDVLQASQQPQLLQPVFAGIRAPRSYQSSVGIERELNKYAKVSATWIDTRGAHLLDSRNINTPIAGSYPFGDPSIRLLTESAGFSRVHQLVVNVNVNYKKLALFGYYGLSYAQDDNEALPADPYNLRAEWGPASWGDIRHRVALGGSVPLKWKVTMYPFLAANSGYPYNITTGLDPLNTGAPTARPALRDGVPAGSCSGGSLAYAPRFGCFDSKPAIGASTIGHNFARGPADVNLVLRVARTWSFGGEARSTQQSNGGRTHELGNGPPAGMFDTSARGRYNLTLSASTLNALNRSNFAPPNGDLSSPYFGQYRTLGGMVVLMHGGLPSTYNRKIDLQIRFTF